MGKDAMFYTSLPELKKLEHQNLAYRRKAFRTFLISLFRKKGSNISTRHAEASDGNHGLRTSETLATKFGSYHAGVK